MPTTSSTVKPGSGGTVIRSTAWGGRALGLSKCTATPVMTSRRGTGSAQRIEQQAADTRGGRAAPRQSVTLTTQVRPPAAADGGPRLTRLAGELRQAVARRARRR